jgi:diaminohydroxyphosphoribosylaminopyrimidine deaminase/5-amino-6-(5-phosphoribosylamino)uracil reductase
VIGARDPNPLVDGRGAAALAAAGIAVTAGVLEPQARELIAPFAKLMTQRRPWVIAKWAMTLDGKIAASTGDSRWISGEASRARVHALRGRVDAVVVGRGTVAADDPLLTARPRGARTATRVVLDSSASLSLDSQLVRTAREAPVLVVAAYAAPSQRCEALRDRGVEVWQSGPSDDRQDEAPAAPGVSADLWLDELGRRQMTNVLVEGGGQVLGSLFDAGAIDEVHAFIAPKIAGGSAPAPIAGRGIDKMAAALQLAHPLVELLEHDVYIHGRLGKSEFLAS